MLRRNHQLWQIIDETHVQACPNQNTCEACPANSRRNPPGAFDSVSPQSEIDSVSCQCDPGYAADCDWSPSQSLDCFRCTCNACPAGTYKTWTGNTPCEICPVNQEAEFDTGSMACVQCAVGAESEAGQSCTCKTGYSSNTESCSDWGWQDGSWYDCTWYTTNGCAEQHDYPRLNSMGVFEDAADKCCACGGETGRLPNCALDAECRACAPNHYVSEGTCVTCPDNSHNGRYSNTDEPQFSINSCTCNQGFIRQTDYGNTDLTGCQACVTGKYMPYPEGVCTACPSGKSTVSTGATQVTECLCDQGYGYTNGNACEQCVSGSYKSNIADVACVTCGDHTVGPTGAVNCNGHDCKPGAAGFGRSYLYLGCSLCHLNTFKHSTGSDSCTQCPDNSGTGSGSYLTETGATSIFNCECNAGYSGPRGETCTECGTGTYKSTQGTSNCVDCPPNSYTELSASTSIASCVCNAGYEGAPGLLPQPQECSQCKAGKYKPDIGGQPCQLCPDHSNTPSTGSTSSTDCACNAGYTGPVTYNNVVNGACTACVEGKFKPTTGSEDCTECTPHSSSPAGSISWSACTCLSGYDGHHVNGCTRDCNLGRESIEQDGIGTCQLCPNGKYSDSTGPEACTACSENSHMDEGVTGATSHAECKCDAGYWDSGASCTACESGKFNRDSDSSQCYDCYVPYGWDCVPGNDVRLMPYQTGSSTSCPDICRVPVGWQATDDDNGIEPCPPNYYNDDVTNLQCTQCPWPSTHTSAGALTSLQQCTCRSGYYRPDAQSSCTAAGIGFYAEGADADRWGCPTDATSLQSATASVSDCVCNAGYTASTTALPYYGPNQFRNGVTVALEDRCTACPSGTFKYVASDQACITCPDNSQLPASSPHLSASCRCNAGYTGPSASCTACLEGSYKTSYGSSECTDCTADASTAASASTAVTECSCNSGYEPASEEGLIYPDDTCVSSCGPGTTKVDNAVPPCQDCDAGTYKPDVGAQACTPCPAPRNASRVGAVDADDCSCRAGELDVIIDSVKVVTSIGAYTGSTAQVLASDGTDTNTIPNLYYMDTLQFTWTSPPSSITVTVKRHGHSITIFQCDSQLDCEKQKPDASSMIDMHAIYASITLASSNTMDMNIQYFTRRAVETADVLTPAAGDWTSDAAVEQLALSAQLRPGDYIFKDTWLGSTPTHCVPCAPGMWCAASIAASIAA